MVITSTDSSIRVIFRLRTIPQSAYRLYRILIEPWWLKPFVSVLFVLNYDKKSLVIYRSTLLQQQFMLSHTSRSNQGFLATILTQRQKHKLLCMYYFTFNCSLGVFNSLLRLNELLICRQMSDVNEIYCSVNQTVPLSAPSHHDLAHVIPTDL